MDESLPSSVEPDRPRLDRVDHEMGLAPRIASPRGADHVLRLRLDGMRHAPVAGERPTEDDEPGRFELVHVRRVLGPARLLLHRLGRIPRGPVWRRITRNIATRGVLA